MKQLVRFMAFLTVVMVILSASLFAEPVTIRWAFYPVNANFDGTMQKAAQEFMKTHPDIKVEVEITPDLWTKLQVQQASGTAPDIAVSQIDWMPAGAESGMWVDLLPLMKADGIKTTDYFPIAMDDWTYKGHLYGGILYWGGETFVINKDLFDTAGIRYPDSSWNWDTVLQNGKKLTRDLNGDGKTDQYGISTQQNAIWSTPATFVRSNGGEVLNEARDKCLLNSEEAIKAIEFFTDLDRTYGVAVPYGSPIDKLHLSQGNVAIAWGGTWEPNQYVQNKINWMYATPPTGPVRRNLQVGSNAWAILSSTKHPKEAWELMKWLMTKPGQDITGVLSIPGYRPSALSSQYIEKWKNYNITEYLDAVQKWGHPYYPTIDWGPWTSAVNVQLDAAYRGLIPVREALNKATSAVNQIFANRKK